MTAETAKWDEATSIEELPVISAICVPAKDECVKIEDENVVTVKGEERDTYLFVL